MLLIQGHDSLVLGSSRVKLENFWVESSRVGLSTRREGSQFFESTRVGPKLNSIRALRYDTWLNNSYLEILKIRENPLTLFSLYLKN
jgi:hypothetical protein